MTAPVCYLNGRFVAVGDARISPLDRGFLFGEGLFETWRTYRGRPYGLTEHLRRMAGSAKRLAIAFDPRDPWLERCTELARQNGMTDRDGAVRLTITRGRGPISLTVDATEEPTTLMLFRPLEPGLAEAKRTGVSVWPVSVGSGVSERLRQIKSLNYLPAVLARAEARRRGSFEAVYCTDSGTVLEGTTSNFFVVRRGRVLTAPISLGLLPGVTRRKTIALARALGEVVETAFAWEDVLSADEAFLTASSIEVVPVVRVGKRRIGSGRPGPFALELQARYRAKVARSLGLRVEQLGE